MEKNNTGLWVGTAIAIAVVVVAVSVPRDPKGDASVQQVTTSKEFGPTGGVSMPSPVAPTVSSPPAHNVSTPHPSETPHSATSTTVLPAPRVDPDDVPPPQPVVALPPANRENARQAIDDIQLVIRDFRTGLGGNPVGTNAEITNALLGNNLKQLKLKIPDNSRLNGVGELCDLWGTPYFFHQISGTVMEIRSAGPDLKLWTSDDITK